MGTKTEEELALRKSAGLGRLLRVSIFRNLLIADLVSDMGAFMQNVGAAWLMVSLRAGPGYVALIQTAASLPYFLLALPAGSAGDIFDRRRLILYTEAWMMGIALILAVLTISGSISPWLLLALTFALSAGDAFETPTWRAILPELVSMDDLAAASALNGIEFNIARAVGPALAGMVIAAAGVAAAFVANFVSFFGVILVVARWKRPIRKQTAPAETMTGATVAAIRYVRNSPAILTVLVRTGIVMFFSSSLFALMPSLAKSVNESAVGYGVLLGCFGAGAIGGALMIRALRARFSTEMIVSAGVVILGIVIVTIARLHSLSAFAPVILLGGAAWVLFISLINALVETLAPDWVRARVLAVFTLVYMGSFALGSAAWGGVAERRGIGLALICSGFGTVGSVLLAWLARLPDCTADLTPWNHWRMPLIVKEVGAELLAGPVLVTVEYSLVSGQEAEFVKTIRQYARTRRRNGAYRWGIYRDTEVADRFVEIFLVHSWAEHLRQHERQTKADLELEQRVSSYVSGEPKVRHLLYADSTKP
ncbi:MAG TPA: MFS transporter [Terriglobales bacterium]|nr:MFS transporter [Terriglobales bacterium]